MHPIKLLFSGSIALFFLACGGSASPSQLFEIELEGNSSEFPVNANPEVSIRNKKDKPIGSVTYSIDDQTLPLEDNRIQLNVETLGVKELVAHIAYDDQSVSVSKRIQILARQAPQVYTYEVINEFPHDREAFTQGLEFHEDTLYESTGQKGTSSLRKVAYQSGEILQKTDLDDRYFGEGITLMNGKIFQLTWQSGTGFIYDKESLERIGSFKYGESKEGWGLCNDGQRIYKSDGTEKIWILDPETLQETGYIQIVTNKSVFNKANELEYVDGKIYANVWQKESMMIIDATTGAIEGVVNFGGLKERVTQHPKLDVLNGVAYHPGRKSFFVTGKRWDKMFEVRLKPKSDEGI